MEFLERGAVADADEGYAGGAEFFVKEAFVFLVERAGGFVEKGNGGLFQKEPGEGDALLFAKGKHVGARVICSVPWVGGIGAAREPSGSGRGFLRGLLCRVNPGPWDSHADRMAVSCSRLLPMAGLVLVFS